MEDFSVNGCLQAARRAGTELPQTQETREAVSAMGVTRRQLEYWVEMGWVRSADPPAKGHPRVFSDGERRVLALMARLTGTGLPARVAAPIAREVISVQSLDGAVDVRLAPGLVLTVRDA